MIEDLTWLCPACSRLCHPDHTAVCRVHKVKECQWCRDEHEVRAG
jgi:hypothetical protein